MNTYLHANKTLSSEEKEIQVCSDKLDDLIKSSYIYLAKLYILENRPIVEAIDYFETKNNKIYELTKKKFNYTKICQNLEFCFDILNNYQNYSELYDELLTLDNTVQRNPEIILGELSTLITNTKDKYLKNIIINGDKDVIKNVYAYLEQILTELNLETYKVLKGELDTIRYHIEITHSINDKESYTLFGMSNKYFIQCLDMDELVMDDYSEYVNSIDEFSKIVDDYEYLINYIAVTYLSNGLYDTPLQCNIKIVSNKEEIILTGNRKIKIILDENNKNKLIVNY
jgi:hypothetical protein